ncbi:unnamed protein product [Sphagnum jensenii]|uniref:Uncharacterized protein n=1 Tax=Sphagnum jensenii TaxID=128206 RepID=A0ABP0WII0_9BRYO
MAAQGGIKAVTETNGVKEKIVSGKNSFASGLAPDKKRSLRKDDGAERNEHEEGDKEEESEDNEELSTDNANKTDAAAPDGWANFFLKSMTGDIEPPHKGSQKQKGSQANDNNSNGATVPELLTTLETTQESSLKDLQRHTKNKKDSSLGFTSAQEEEETMKQRRELREE